MKKSNKLLVTILSLFILVTMGSNMILKSEYEKMDFNQKDQNAEKLVLPDFIDDYPIKIDGGNFYTYDTTSLSGEKWIFITNKDKTGFIQQAGKFKIMRRVKRQLSKNGYSDLYKGDDYEFSLSVNKSGEAGKDSSEYVGTMVIRSGKMARTLKIHGMAE